MIRVRLGHRQNTLCETCDNSLRIVDGDDRLDAWCHTCHPPMRVPDVVKSCSDYTSRLHSAPRRMHELAFVLEVDKKGQMVGFRPPKKTTTEDPPQ